MVSENGRIRNIFIAKAFPGHADVDALKAGSLGDLAALQSNGAVVANDSDIIFLSKNNKGSITKSDVILPKNVTSATVTEYSAGVAKKVTVSDITVTANKLYSVDVIFAGYGSLSVENEMILKGYYKAKASDSAENIVDGLVQSLSRAFGRQEPSVGTKTTYTKAGGSTVEIKDNIWFTFKKGFTLQTIDVDTAPTADGNATVTLNGVNVTVALLDLDTDSGAATKIAAAIDAVNGFSSSATGTVVTITSTSASIVSYDAGVTGTTVTFARIDANAGLIITETQSTWLSKYYVTGKKIRTSLNYTVVVGFNDISTTSTIVGSDPKGSGYQARNLEYYLLGNRQDSYRTMGYPHNFDVEYDTVLTDKYNTVELSYFDVSRDDPKESKKQITILIPYTNLAGNSVTNGLITEINKSLNSSSVQISTLAVV